MRQLWRVFDFGQVYQEDQGLVGRTPVTEAVAAIGQLRRDHQFPCVAGLHQLQRFAPARDHAADLELRRSRGLGIQGALAWPATILEPTVERRPETVARRSFDLVLYRAERAQR